MRDTLQARLDAKKAELKKRQDDFKIFLDTEIDTSCFERNAIADLMVMMQLKSEIKEIEFALSLK